MSKPKKPTAAPAWRNRIVGHGEVPAESLTANPRNWRTHPQSQLGALSGVLSEVGWVQDVIVNQRTGLIVDGHARVQLAVERKESVPVVYVDLDEAEEGKILAALDPLGAMAGADKDLLAGLLEDVSTDSADLRMMFLDLEQKAEIIPPADAPEEFKEYDEQIETEHQCPKCGYQWSGKAA
jgi:hypothetical protein